MKKMLFFIAMCLGFMSTTQGQILEYYVANGSSTDTWSWAIDDAGPSPATYELNIAPNTQRQGVLNFFSFPVDWKASNNNGCYVSNTDFGPVGATTLTTTCSGVTVVYKIVEIVPFVHYIFKAELG